MLFILFLLPLHYSRFCISLIFLIKLYFRLSFLKLQHLVPSKS